MSSVLLLGEPVGSRIHPARRPRWRRYAAPALLTLLGGVLLALPASALTRFEVIGLSTWVTRVVLGSLAVLFTAGVTEALDRPALIPLGVGVLAISIGANVFVDPWTLAPLVVVGLGWILVLELLRLFDGLRLTRDGVAIARLLRTPLELSYDELRAVHATPEAAGAGAIILETEHGTVTAPAIPRCEAVQARIEARMRAVPIDPTAGSMQQARERIEDLLGRGGTRS